MNQAGEEHLQIAFFGSSLASSYWNGAATYYRGLIRALHDLGHRVTFYEPDILDRQKHRDLPEIDWATMVVYEAGRAEDVLAAVERASDADVVVKASGVGAYDDLLEREVARLGEGGGGRPMTVFWDVDAPATLDRLDADPADPFRELVPAYDFVLTYGGGDEIVRRYERFGARACVPIYNAADPDVHHPVEPEERFAADLTFLGNRLPDREARVEEFFFSAARLLPGSSFLLGGSGWEPERLPPNVGYLGHVYVHEHNALNCTPRAVLNVSRESMARAGFSPATRIFEAAAAAACLITDEWPGIDAFFEPGEEILVAQSGTDVAEILAGLEVDRARRIGAAARRRVLASHTYAKRAAEVTRLLGRHVRAAAGAQAT
jgi:spore maturation protein CgeB